MAHHYTATHSSGQIHLRKSDRPYTHAAVGPRPGQANWASRRDLAAAHLGRRFANVDEVRPVVEVTSTEFARLTKASKRHFKTTFMGKTYTHTILAGDTIDTLFPVGIDEVEHLVRHPVPEAWMTTALQSVAYAEECVAKWGEKHQSYLDRAKERVESVKALQAQGYHEVKHRGRTSVYWTRSESEANHTVKHGHQTAAFKFAQRLEAIEV